LKPLFATTSTFAKYSSEVLTYLKENGFELIINPFGRKLSEGELLELLKIYRPIGLLAGTEPITRSTLEKAKSYLKIISRVGVGWDNVDRDAAREFGIKVYRTEEVLNYAVAELTLGMMLSALRAIPLQDRRIRAGVWQKGMGRLLEKKIVGIIGFGSIGQRVGELVKAFGARVLYYDPIPKDVPWAQARKLNELLSQADIITLHASGSARILGEHEINSLCKPGVIIINAARGGLVDEKALYNALVSGHVTFACLDVFEKEPYKGPLKDLDNVILTPHIGSYALEARMEMEKMAVENLLKGLRSISQNSVDRSQESE